MAKAVLELDGPIYVHCHHGKHRSPAAAAVACITSGLITRSQVQAVLETAGTNPHYLGLFESVANARPQLASTLHEMDVTFAETAEIPPLAEAMVALEHRLENLNALKRNSWNAPERHPDLNAAHEALLLQEIFTEMLRAEFVQSRPGEFQAAMKSAELFAAELHSSLAEPSFPNESNLGVADKILESVVQSCGDCHQTYRDSPNMW
ncbi:MAG: hypothetical protein R3C03_10270 [Pirellulaceae bacterium]